MNNEILRDKAENTLNQARALNKLNRSEEALKAYQSAEQLFAELSDERGRTRCWSGIAKCYGKQKLLEPSANAFGEAALHARLAAWPEKEIEACYNQGLTLQQVGLKGATLEQVERAIEAFKQGLAVAKESQDKASAGVLLLSLGFACAWAKRDPEAIAYFSEAVPFALEGIDFDTAFSALSSLGVLLSNAGRGREAVPHLERALAMAKTAEGDIVAVADTFANLGIAYEKAGRLEEAIEAMDTYREILHVSGDVKAATAAAMVKRLKQKAGLK